LLLHIVLSAFVALKVQHCFICSGVLTNNPIPCHTLFRLPHLKGASTASTTIQTCCSLLFVKRLYCSTIQVVAQVFMGASIASIALSGVLCATTAVYLSPSWSGPACVTGLLRSFGHLQVSERGQVGLFFSILRVGQNRISAPYMTVCMVISLLKTPYVHRIYL